MSFTHELGYIVVSHSDSYLDDFGIQRTKSMPTQDLLAIILGLLLSGTWLIYKLNRFQWVQKINDPKGIVVPSFIFLLSPFLAVWIMPALASGDIDEIIKPILPLITFILGQVITKREKQREIKQQKIALATMIIYNVETNIIESLSRIEGQLMASIQNAKEEAITDKIKLLLGNFEPEMQKLHEKLSFQLDVIKIGAGIGTLVYIEKIKNDVKRMESIPLSPENKLYSLADIRLHIIEGYANVIILVKESIPNDESIYTRFLNGCISKLNQERERLMQLRKMRKSIMEFWKDKPKSERPKNSEMDLYSQFDIDPEGEAIREIESLLQRFDMPITTADLDSHISDFEITPMP
jgi:hypothetical protein